MKQRARLHITPLLFFASAAIVLLLALAVRHLMLESSSMIESGTRQQLQALSRAVAALTTAEKLDEFKTPEDMQKPEYMLLRLKLDEFARETGLRFAFYMRLDPETDKMQFIIDNVLSPLEDADGLDSPQVPREKGPDLALRGRVNVVGLGSYSIGWDGLLTAWAPIHYADGRLSNIVAGVDLQDIFITRNRNNAYIMSGILVCATVLVILLCVLSTVLYRRKANQATQASQAKSSFLSHMSHEMRTPLNAITGLSSMALESDNLDTIKEHLNKVKTSSQHLRSLIDDILDISKIESGKMELEFVVANLQSELSNIKSIIIPQTDAKQQIFNVNVDMRIPRNLRYDVVHVRQVIVNMLSNAIKFTPLCGSVGLSATLLEQQDDKCNIEWRVKDSGIGIEPEKINSLFNAFEQADASITRRFGGTGLGLAISKQLVEMMGGKIRVTSVPGQGSEFIFNTWVIAAPDDADTKLDTQPVDGRILDLTGHHLLLVEDAEINQLIAVDLFEKYGATVDIANDGQEGYDAFIKNPDRYAIIFMDIQMPVMDGYTSTRKIRDSGIPQARTIPIVAMTANVFKEDVDNAFAAGMNGHLKKPLEVDQIEQLIGALRPDLLKEKE